MPLDFPPTPSLNQIYTDSSSGKSWIWNGSAWDTYSNSVYVNTLNGLTGGVTLSGGTYINISLAGNIITISSPGDGPCGYVSSFNGLVGAVQGVSSWNGQTGTVTFTNYVSSFNGSTGAVQGVGSIIATSGISINPSGGTGNVTIYNTGVTGINGLTGSITNVARTNSDNQFSSLQTFNLGLESSGGTFTGNISINGVKAGIASAGSSNVLFSNTGLSVITFGSLNSAFGNGCLANFLSGSANAGNGVNSLNGLTQGDNNAAFGNGALYFVKSGSNNVGLGYRAGSIAVGSNINQCIYIGSQTVASSNTATNEIVLGYQQTGLGSNTTLIGSPSHTQAKIYGIIDSPSGVSAAGATFSSSINVTGNVTGTGALIGYQQINAQTGTSYTVALTDVSKLVTLNNASAITLTIPLNSSVAFPTGTVLYFAQLGAGQVGFTGASGVTVNYTPGRYLRTQYSTASAVQLSTNVWLLSGDLTA